jgi:hypothetical protein
MNPRNKPLSRSRRIAVWSAFALVVVAGIATTEAKSENGNGKGQGKDDPQDLEPFPTTQYYFKADSACPNYDWGDDVFCDPTRHQHMMTRAPPNESMAKVEYVNRLPLVLRPLIWEKPAADSAELHGDDVTVIVFADAPQNALWTHSDVWVTLWTDEALDNRRELAYVPDTGIVTPLGVANGQFVATFRNITSVKIGGDEPSRLQVYLAAFSLLEPGAFDVRFDSVDSPSCVVINGVTCSVS